MSAQRYYGKRKFKSHIYYPQGFGELLNVSVSYSQAPLFRLFKEGRLKSKVCMERLE